MVCGKCDYLCGSEFLIDITLSTILQYFSIIPNFANVLSVYIYVMVALLFGHRVFVPLEKSVLRKLGC